MVKTRIAALVVALAFAGGFLLHQATHWPPSTEQASVSAPAGGKSNLGFSDQNGQRAATRAAQVPVEDLVTLQARIQTNERKLAELDALIGHALEQRQDLEEDRLNQLADLQRGARQQQERIATIEAQLQAQGLAGAAQQKNRETAINEDSFLLQQQLSALQSQIRSQEALVAAKQLQLNGVSAPEESDLVQGYQEQLKLSQDQLAALRTEYAGLLRRQTQLVEQGFANENQRIQNQQAGQANLQVAEAEAKQELSRYNAEYQRLSQTSPVSPEDAAQLEQWRNQQLTLQKETEGLKDQYRLKSLQPRANESPHA